MPLLCEIACFDLKLSWFHVVSALPFRLCDSAAFFLVSVLAPINRERVRAARVVLLFVHALLCFRLYFGCYPISVQQFQLDINFKDPCPNVNLYLHLFVRLDTLNEQSGRVTDRRRIAFDFLLSTFDVRSDSCSFFFGYCLSYFCAFVKQCGGRALRLYMYFFFDSLRSIIFLLLSSCIVYPLLLQCA